MINVLLNALQRIDHVRFIHSGSIERHVYSNVSFILVAIALPIVGLISLWDLICGIRNKDVALILINCLTFTLCFWVFLFCAFLATTGGSLTALG